MGMSQLILSNSITWRDKGFDNYNHTGIINSSINTIIIHVRLLACSRIPF